MTKIRYIFFIFLALFFLIYFRTVKDIYAASIDVAGKAKELNTNNYLDFNSTYLSNVKIDNSTGNFSGYAFSTDLGWVAFGTEGNSEGPVVVSLSTGNVTGKAKVLNTGNYLDFTNYQSNVLITLTTGVFSGYVFSTDVGWIDFSDTGVSSEALVTPTSTPTHSSTTNSSNSTFSSSSNPPGCSDSAPSSAPDLFQIDTTKSTAILSFVTANKPVTKHFIAYGVSQDNFAYGGEFNQGFSSGVVSYSINLLSANATYYFKIRGGNGCMPGDWSSVISAKTKGTIIDTGSNFISDLAKPLTGSSDSLDITVKEQKKEEVSTIKEKEEIKKEGVKVTVKVVNVEQKPVAGASVSLFSKPKTEVTDKDGFAYFYGIERGKHTLKIVYQNYSGEEKLDLSGDTIKEHKVTIEIKKTKSYIIWWIIPLILIAFYFIYFLFNNT